VAVPGWLEKVRERAKAALAKPAEHGPDIDVTQFDITTHVDESAAIKAAERAGVSVRVPAFYIQADSAYFNYLSKIPGIEVYRLEEFIEANRDLAKDYVWRLVPPDMDKYTAVAALRGVGGYVIRVKSGVKVEQPVLACLSIVRGGLQAPHNVVIAEEGADVVVYTGCTIAPEAVGLHAAISEFYVMRKAKLKFVMVHGWNAATHVRPRAAALVGEEAEYAYYYANLAAVKTLQASPRTLLKDGARAYSVSVLLGPESAQIDVGSVAVLDGADSAAEIVSRALATARSSITMRALVEARKPARGHIECSGLLMSESANITTVPLLAARHKDASLTHEASIGKLAEEEINYLMAKGLSYEEAVSMLVRGFVTTDIHKYLPEWARQYVESVERLIIQKAL
jgi:Fe-S cluster assembly scaffold protein SufB